jgi:hypothetical protein
MFLLDSVARLGEENPRVNSGHEKGARGHGQQQTFTQGAQVGQ